MLNSYPSGKDLYVICKHLLLRLTIQMSYSIIKANKLVGFYFQPSDFLFLHTDLLNKTKMKIFRFTCSV